MKPTEAHIDELIAKYLAGEATPEEAMMLDDWRQESPEHEQYLLASALALQQPIPSVDTAALYQKIEAQVTRTKPKRITLWPRSAPMRVAASVLLLSLIGLTFYVVNNQQATPEQTYASGTHTRSEQLADGSTVTLNKRAKLTLLKGFNTNQRNLKLEGEAYFEVVHNDTKPFTIDAGGIEITDIGTAFNVQAYPESDSVIVQVTEGIVNLTTPDTALQLTANQSALFIRSQHSMRRIDRYDPNRTAYRTKTFRFRAQQLGTVLSTLNEVYDEHITVSNPLLSDCLITVDFSNESPETIVGIISETLGLTFRKTATGYELSGNVCIP